MNTKTRGLCSLLLTLPLLAPSLASPPPAHAFALSVHKQILRDALGGRMSEQALGWVTGYYAVVFGSGNLGSDVHLLTPARHFANAPTPTVVCQRWRDGLHRFVEQAVVESAPGGAGLRSIPRRKEALTVFGEATHTLADFYAHTNWIELAVARHKRPSLAPLLGDQCNPSAFPPGLQSGYANHFKAGPSGLLSGCPRKGPPKPFRYCDSQLNKDDDQAGHHGHVKALSDGTTYFQLAVQLSTQATAALWQSLHQRILARYGAKRSVDAPCVFNKLAWGGTTSCQKRGLSSARATAVLGQRRAPP